MCQLETLNGKRTDTVLTPAQIAHRICDHMGLDDTVKALIDSKIASNVIESGNKSTVFGDIGQNNQAKLCDSINHNVDNLFVENPQTGRTIAETLVLAGYDKAENRGLEGIQIADTVSMYVSTFSKIMARHLTEMDLCELISGKMGDLEDETQEIDIWTNDGKSVQILTSSAKNPKSAAKKIDNPSNVDKYVVIHYKNDGSAGIGVQDVKVDEKVPQSERAHLIARDC